MSGPVPTPPGDWLARVEAEAARLLPAPVRRFVEEGAGEGITLRESREAWRSVRLLPRVLVDVSNVRTEAPMLGAVARFPLGVAPMTLQRAAHRDGEVAMARGAAEAGVPLVVSSNAGRTFAEIGATGVTWWLQLYLSPDRSDSEGLLAAAVAAGARAVVLTADTPVVATRSSTTRAGGAGEPGGGADVTVWETADPSWVGANATSPTDGLEPARRPRAMDLLPADVTWLAAKTELPVVVKGVLRADDAQRCVQAGAAAVWLSNHGGRQLDRAVPAARCLQSVRRAVGSRAEVYVDGGLRSGLDLLVALALGADAAFVGRPAFHALAAGGAAGVAEALGSLGAELVEAMRLAGCPDLAATREIACPDRGFSVETGPDLREPPV